MNQKEFKTPQIPTEPKPLSEKEKRKKEWEQKLAQAQADFESKRKQLAQQRPLFKCFGWCKKKHSASLCPRCMEILWKWIIIVLLLIMIIIFLVVYFYPPN